MKNKLGFLLVSYFSLMFLILISIGNASTRIEYQTIDAEGMGGSLQQAVERALIVGINKINGAIISSRVKNFLTQKTLTTNNKKIIETNKFFEESIAKRTRGIIKSYEILSQKRDKQSNLYRVLIRATVPVVKQNSQLRRIRLVFGPLRISENTTPKSQTRKFEKRFRQRLENYITQSRKFAVLDRRFLQEQDVELDFLKKSGTNPNELARLGNRAGADYLITGLVERAQYKTSKTVIKTTGKLIKNTRALAKINIKIIDIVSTQIKFSASVELSQKSGSMETLAKNLAEILGRKIIDAIFPISVLEIHENTLTLGQGGTTIKIGENYNLIALGKNLIDSYTGETLGRHEETVGVIEIIGRQSKVSTGRIIDLRIARDDLSKRDLIVRQQPKNNRKRDFIRKFSDIEKMINRDFQTD